MNASDQPALPRMDFRYPRKFARLEPDKTKLPNAASFPPALFKLAFGVSLELTCTTREPRALSSGGSAPSILEVHCVLHNLYNECCVAVVIHLCYHSDWVPCTLGCSCER